MPAISGIIAATAISASAASTIGAVASVVGTVAGVAGQVTQAQGQRKAQAAQQRAELIRQRQMETESRRKQMELIRQQQIARSTSLTNVTASGGSAEGGSALGGAEGTISGQFGRGIQQEQSNLAFGNMMFDANRQVLAGQAQAARGGTIANAGAGLVSLGGAFINNADRIGRIGGRK